MSIEAEWFAIYVPKMHHHHEKERSKCCGGSKKRRGERGFRKNIKKLPFRMSLLRVISEP